MSYPPAAPGRTVLSRELSDFILDFLGAHQRFTMYPEGHPLLEPAVVNVLRRLEVLFQDKATVSIGVTPRQLLISGIPTDPNNVVLSDLAGRLHRGNIGGVRFSRGVEGLELITFLQVLASDPGQAMEAGHDEPNAAWPHIRLFPLTYDHLELQDDEDETSIEDRMGASWASRLWVTLARVGLGEDTSEEAAAKVDPVRLAKAIDSRPMDARQDERIVQTLSEFAEACKGKGRAEALALQRQLSSMVGALAPGTLRRLMTMGGDLDRRRRFLVDSSEVMAANVVLSLVDAAAHASGRTMSPALLQLFTKLAAHAEEGPPAIRSKADLVLRQRVQQLVERWKKDEAASGISAGYQQTLEHLPSSPALGREAVVVYGCEPQRVLLMSLELGVVEVGTRQAVDRMLEDGETALLLDLLERVPEHDPVGRELRHLVYNRHTVQMVLSTDPIDLALLARLVPHAGAGCLGVLLDALAAANDRKARSKLLDLVVHLGPSIGPELIARIPGAPWFVQRNLLKLLSMLPATSEGFSLDQCLEHEDPRVRHEALKILLRDPATRTEALCRSLEASDHPTERLGLMAAAESCPPEVVPLIIDKLHRGGGLDPDVRAVAVRAIAPVQDPLVLECLVGLALVRSRWFWTRRLAPKSPVLLAVLTALATHWVWHPQAEPVLGMAARHKDSEVRKAGTPHPNPRDADDRKLPQVII